jgi:voltage-gated sodium channel
VHTAHSSRYTFTVELLLKLIGCGLAPLSYFHNPWNILDFVVVTSSYIEGSGQMIMMLRLLRVLLLLKMLNGFPEMKVRVAAG